MQISRNNSSTEIFHRGFSLFLSLPSFLSEPFSRSPFAIIQLPCVTKEKKEKSLPPIVRTIYCGMRVLRQVSRIQTSSQNDSGTIINNKHRSNDTEASALILDLLAQRYDVREVDDMPVSTRFQTLPCVINV